MFARHVSSTSIELIRVGRARVSVSSPRRGAPPGVSGVSGASGRRPAWSAPRRKTTGSVSAMLSVFLSSGIGGGRETAVARGVYSLIACGVWVTLRISAACRSPRPRPGSCPLRTLRSRIHMRARQNVRTRTRAAPVTSTWAVCSVYTRLLCTPLGLHGLAGPSSSKAG
jgi:hypothetical protein